MEPEIVYRSFRFPGVDGTSLVGWTNDADGPPLLVCNGLGTPPEAWPKLLHPEAGYHVAGWNHRGGLGSERPVDPERIRVTDHVDDAFALMDEMGWDSAVLLGWSIGVNVSFEMAKRHPERVDGIVALAGIPGGTFEAGFAPLMALGVTQGGRALSGPLNLLARTVPKGRPFAEVLRLSGFMMPHADAHHAVPWIRAFLEHDFHWYFTLGVAASEHEPLDPSFVEVPVTIAAGGFDVMTSMRDVVAFAEKIPHAVTHVLHGTHMLPLEFPDEILEMVHDVYAKVTHSAEVVATEPTTPEPALEPADVSDHESPADNDLPWWASPPGQFT